MLALTQEVILCVFLLPGSDVLGAQALIKKHQTFQVSFATYLVSMVTSLFTVYYSHAFQPHIERNFRNQLPIPLQGTTLGPAYVVVSG